MDQLKHALEGRPGRRDRQHRGGVMLAIVILVLLIMLLLRRPPQPQSSAAPELEKLSRHLARNDGRARCGSKIGRGAAGRAERTGVAKPARPLSQRLAAVDRAQANIEKLSGDVLGLQDILTNNPARGAFGEIQLKDLVSSALPPSSV